MKKFTLFLVVLFATLRIQASHIVGGQLTATCLGGLTYEVKLNLNRDIQGVPISPQRIDYKCNTIIYSVFNTVNTAGVIATNGSIETHQFIDTITLPYYNASYTISSTICCRPASITNINNPSTTSQYLDVLIYTDSICNSTPVISNLIPTLGTVNSYYYHSLNAVDVDGDSLVYSTMQPMNGAFMLVPGYIQPNQLNVSNTGIISFLPLSSGMYVFCIKITEYRNGLEIGYTFCEMQVYVGIFNDINEIKTQSNRKLRYVDLLGRNVDNNYNGLKLFYE